MEGFGLLCALRKELVLNVVHRHETFGAASVDICGGIFYIRDGILYIWGRIFCIWDGIFYI